MYAKHGRLFDGGPLAAPRSLAAGQAHCARFRQCLPGSACAPCHGPRFAASEAHECAAQHLPLGLGAGMWNEDAQQAPSHRALMDRRGMNGGPPNVAWPSPMALSICACGIRVSSPSIAVRAPAPLPGRARRRRDRAATIGPTPSAGCSGPRICRCNGVHWHLSMGCSGCGFDAAPLPPVSHRGHKWA